jgi:hypothetical protein
VYWALGCTYFIVSSENRDGSNGLAASGSMKGKKLLHERGIGLIHVGIVSRGGSLCTRHRRVMVIVAAIVKHAPHIVIVIVMLKGIIMVRGQPSSSDCFLY